MKEIYNTTVNAVQNYMYPKSHNILNAKAAKPEAEEPSLEVVSVEVEETASVVEDPAPEVVVIDASEELKEINPKEMKKSELIEYIQTIHGEDADVSGTKAEIIDRYFS